MELTKDDLYMLRFASQCRFVFSHGVNLPAGMHAFPYNHETLIGGGYLEPCEFRVNGHFVYNAVRITSKGLAALRDRNQS